MKKVFMLAAFVIAAVPSMAQVLYAVSGTYAKNGKKIYLIDELTELKIDSTVVGDGRFSFTGTAAKDALLAVRAKSSSWTTQFFNDGIPENILIDPQGKIIDRGLRGKALHTRLEKELGVSIALTFGTAAIIDYNAKQKAKREIVMMVMYDMYNSLQSIEKAATLCSMK